MWTDVIQYYKNLLIAQYRAKSKAQGTIGTLINCSVCEGLPLQLQNAFNLSTAYGAQLTILGKIVGVPRNVIGLDLLHSFFSFTRYSGSPASTGFGRYNSQPDAVLFRRYAENATYTLSDFELRALIRLKIIYNTRYATFSAIKNGLWTYFHGDIDIVLTADSTDTWFNFTRYGGSPASHGFSRYAGFSNDGYFFYRYNNSQAMQITFKVKTVYQNAFTSAIFLNIVPTALGVGVTAQYT